MNWQVLFKYAFIIPMVFLGIYQTNHIVAQTIPAGLKDPKVYEQPYWFNSQRVQIHSRVSQYYNHPDHPIYSNWGRGVVSVVGANTFTRHIKTDDSLIHWESAWGKWTKLANSRNIIQEAVAEAHNNNCRIIGYYNHYTDGYLRDNYPEYKCKDVNGNDVIKKGRGTMLCFNSPFIDSVAVRLVEFARMGGDGIYFDEVHMPREGCWCDDCKRKFKAQTGKDAPSAIDVNSQLYKDYQNFNNQSVIEGFRKWKEELEAENPGLVMIIGSNTLPKLINRHLNTDLFRFAHAHKTEPEIPMRTLKLVPKGIAKPDHAVWRGLSYNFSRDIADGRPAHYWIPGMSFVPDNHIKAFSAGIISFGNIANLDMKENLAPDMDFVPAVKYGNTVSPALTGTKPLRWLLIHFNEKALEKHLGTSPAGWSNFLSAFYGAYYGAQEQHIPVGIITDSQIKQGFFQDAKVLFLPNAETISSELKIKIEEFRKAGGTVISEIPGWDWHLGGAHFESAKKSFKALLDSVSGCPLMQSKGGSSFYYANYFVKKEADTIKYLASYSNSLEWIVVGAKNQTEGRQMAAKSKQPAPVSEIILSVRKGDKPLSVKDVVTGINIPYKILEGVLVVDVPVFQDAALIELTYKSGGNH
uniref:alpha-amylase family protein n=1 Tax=uncultured Draconibacterium sp. TaxID=1573823 RepID=UPI0032171744